MQASDKAEVVAIAQRLADVLFGVKTEHGLYAIIAMIDGLAADFERQEPGAGTAVLKVLHTALSQLYIEFAKDAASGNRSTPCPREDLQ